MGKTYLELNIGNNSEFSKTIAESDIYQFAGITGDFNAVHINEYKAKQTPFKGRIAHGMLAGSLISTVIGTLLPGQGTIYLSQTLNFKLPVRIGDTVKASITVTEKLEKSRVRLKTVCYNQNDDIVVDGEAIVIPPIE